MPRIRLKTKLVLAISAMVFALVATLSYVYVSQLVRQRIREAYSSANFVAKQMRDSARDAIAQRGSPPAPGSSAETTSDIADSLQNDPGMNTLLQSIVGYSLIVY